MRSPNQHLFSVVPGVKTSRSRFDRQSGLKTTFDAGYLIPVFVDEVLPGDTFQVRMTHFARLATPLHPIMDNMYLDSFFFFVPNRLVWDNWVKLQGEKTNPDDAEPDTYSVPEMSAPASTGFAVGSLYDYMGLPTGIPDYKFSALPIRAYNLIYNTWFRPQDLIDSVKVDTGDADSNVADYVLLKRAKRHDYFTACLPYPQKGPDVELPLGTEAPISGLGKLNATFGQGQQTLLDSTSQAGQVYQYTSQIFATGGGNDNLWFGRGTAASGGIPHIYADLTAASAATLNALREAFQTQRLLERDARSGTRYVEVLRAQFGVICPDYRLQRPEYLGGGSSRINTTPIPQSSATVAGQTPQGNLAAMGTSAGQHGFVKSFTEHGFIIGIVCMRADLTYQQGLERFWSKLTRYDFYMPVFANLGEQAVYLKELYCQDPDTDTGSTGIKDNDRVFGYQERWAEYRYKPSRLTGLFRSTAAGTLHTWHLAQEFAGGASLPVLGATFINEDPPVDRVIAVSSEPHIIMDALFENRTTRIMPVYSVPGLVDHL